MYCLFRVFEIRRVNSYVNRGAGVVRIRSHPEHYNKLATGSLTENRNLQTMDEVQQHQRGSQSELSGRCLD
jgi:hypothetical protein